MVGTAFLFLLFKHSIDSNKTISKIIKIKILRAFQTFRQTFLYTVITGTSITTGLYFFNQSILFSEITGLSDLFCKYFLGLRLPGI